MRLSRLSIIVLMMAIIVSMMGLLFGSPTYAQQTNSEFAEPEPLKIDEDLLNADGKMMYPSPAIFDVDNDGEAEMVIGTIFGRLFACENTNAGKPVEPEWQAPAAIKDVDGKPLKLNNW